MKDISKAKSSKLTPLTYSVDSIPFLIERSNPVSK